MPLTVQLIHISEPDNHVCLKYHHWVYVDILGGLFLFCSHIRAGQPQLCARQSRGTAVLGVTGKPLTSSVVTGPSQHGFSGESLFGALSSVLQQRCPLVGQGKPVDVTRSDCGAASGSVSHGLLLDKRSRTAGQTHSAVAEQWADGFW